MGRLMRTTKDREKSTRPAASPKRTAELKKSDPLPEDRPAAPRAAARCASRIEKSRLASRKRVLHGGSSRRAMAASASPTSQTNAAPAARTGLFEGPAMDASTTPAVNAVRRITGCLLPDVDCA